MGRPGPGFFTLGQGQTIQCGLAAIAGLGKRGGFRQLGRRDSQQRIGQPGLGLGLVFPRPSGDCGECLPGDFQTFLSQRGLVLVELAQATRIAQRGLAGIVLNGQVIGAGWAAVAIHPLPGIVNGQRLAVFIRRRRQGRLQGQERRLILQHGQRLGLVGLFQEFPERGQRPIHLAQLLVAAGLAQTRVEAGQVAAMLLVELVVLLRRFSQFGLVLRRAGGNVRAVSSSTRAKASRVCSRSRRSWFARGAFERLWDR